MKKALFAFLAVPLMAGCAVGRPDVSREEWKIRSYEGISKQQIIDAAREVIRLADPDETQFEPKPDGFNAVRRQLSYYVVESGLDVYAFDFVVREEGEKIRARMEIHERVERANLLSLGLPVTSVGKPQSAYIYDLFYSRLDYLLGVDERWNTCQDILRGGDAEQLGVGAFCGRHSSDLVPPPFRRLSGEQGSGQ